MSAALGLLALALLLAGRVPPAPLAPLADSSRPGRAAPASRADRRGQPAQSVPPAVAGVVAAVAVAVVGGPGAAPIALAVGIGAGAAAAAGRRARVAAAHAQARRDAPLFLDVVAAQLRAGAPVALALERAGPLAPAADAAAIAQAAGLLRLGADAAAAWRPLDGGVLADLAVLARRSADSGVRLAEQSARLARDLRADSADRAQAAARRAGVWAMAPLGLCFLPAFFCLGVAPVILGLGRSVLHSGP